MLANTRSLSPTFPQDIRAFLRMQGVMNASHFMTVPLVALYMSMTLHFNSVALATVMSANLLSAQTLPLIAGAVADRFGSRRMLVLGLWLRALGFLGFSVTNNETAWMCFAFAAGSGVACYEAGLYGVFSRQPKISHSALFAANNQMLNMGTAIGPILGGLAALIDARFAFAASALLFGVLGATISRSTVESTGAPDRRAILVTLRAAATNRDLWRLIVVSFPWFFLFPQLYVAFPLYARRLAGPHAASAVYVVNGVIGLAFMLVAKRWLVRMNPAISTMYAYLAAAIAFTSVAAFDNLAWFLLFIAAYTVAETVIFPSLETMTGSLAVDGSQATSFGVLSATGALSGAAGYYAGSWLILNATSLETWATFGSVAAMGFAGAALILPKTIRRTSML
ncbi:MFS transporter [Paraburkholderia caledonica]|uniref:MFS family permease n=1 Tax=Paraburkholderia caledonica TaxID=134536 RepID=A0AB73IQ26_9BURK|nr:MFS family permease [Paraburkholderia caledonica]